MKSGQENQPMKCRSYLNSSQPQNQVKWKTAISDSDWKTKTLVGSIILNSYLFRSLYECRWTVECNPKTDILLAVCHAHFGKVRDEERRKSALYGCNTACVFGCCIWAVSSWTRLVCYINSFTA